MPGLERHVLDRFEQEPRHVHLDVSVAPGPRLLRGDGQRVLDLLRIVRVNLTFDAVLQRRNDRPAIGVVLRVGGERHEQVHRQPNGEPANLNVALLHDVQQADLNARGQVGQLVEAEHAPVGARDDAVVDHLFARVVQAQVGRLDRIDIADQVRHRDVRRGQLLVITLVAVHPFDGGFVAVLFDELLGGARRGGQRVLIEGIPRQHGNMLVEQLGQLTGDARLGLTAQTQQDEVVPGQQGVDDLRNDGLVESDDPRKQGAAGLKRRDEIAADLFLDGNRLIPAFSERPNGVG